MSRPAAETSVLLAFGSNVGDRKAAIERALALIEAELGPLRPSSLYETPPWGVVDQPPFLNLVAAGVTTLDPLPLLRLCQHVERATGRLSSTRWGPRVVDVDLLAYGDVCLRSPDLELPHPRLHERAFVLVPLVEVAPDWRHPRLGLTASELITRLPEDEVRSISRVAPPPGGPAGGQR